ncbi:hypothetical protein OBBRIDRAFT_344387 [Obba rivulosa]|uniref:Uncharacterized protein n=1 Tax=Obba rivulosa TaxID=1052685 RepID=A0A8E2ATJ7_9APHY|nr:hypothetical protein OBBRIDRAFT_344387 [Obba rivulosa]
MSENQWISPAAVAYDGGVWKDFVHGIFGLYVWELLTSMDFDFAYILGKRGFKWPLAFYYANRYIMLGTFIGIVFWTNVNDRLNCLALYTSVQVFANLSLGLANINLSLRTMAIWNMSRRVVVPLVLIIMGHLTLLLVSALPLKALWAQNVGCVTNADNVLILAALIYTMCENFLILILTAWGLAFQLGRRRSSHIATLIFRDGLIFFLVAFSAEILAVIFIRLDLNPVMQTMANVIPTTVSTIAACRAVRRLANFNHGEMEAVHDNSKNAPGRVNFDEDPNSGPPLSVHVHRETLVNTHALPPLPILIRQYDGDANMKRCRTPSDIEANSIMELKRPDF